MTARPSDPIVVMGYLDADALKMDELEKAIGQCADAFDSAEDAWLVCYDDVAESLKDEMVANGRKGDPAEHWIEHETRRLHRDEWRVLRRAKRAWEALDRQRRAKSDAISARQSELGAMRDGFRVDAPRTAQGETFGRRAA